MTVRWIFAVGCTSLVATVAAFAQSTDACAGLKSFKSGGVEITRAASLPAGSTDPNPFGLPGRTAPLPAHCRVEGVINRRVGAGDEEFGIHFALALPDHWNGDFLMQGGGGANGTVLPPIGEVAAGDTPALMRGFAVVSTDSGHTTHGGPFDFAFMKDEQAYLDFAYRANAEVAALAKQLIEVHYNKPAAYSYFTGCSTGGREGMILSQRFPTAFNGIISGDPAMRTGFSNLDIGEWIPVAFNQIAPKDHKGQPLIDQAITEKDRKLIARTLLKTCDAQDGVEDGLISDPLACKLDLAVLTCKAEESDSCLSQTKVEAIKKALAGPKTSEGRQVYPAFPLDTGLTVSAPTRGLLVPGPGPFGPPPKALEIDVEQRAFEVQQPLVDSMSTNLSTFSQDGGKLIFYHGDSDPWFSPLDTFGYYKDMAAANGGLDSISQWSQFYFVPGMTHCAGGLALDHFDLLGALVDWTEKGTSFASVNATGKAFPGRSRPLCAYPKHAQYKGQGDSEKATSFECR